MEQKHHSQGSSKSLQSPSLLLRARKVTQDHMEDALMKERECVECMVDDRRAQDGSPCGELRTDVDLCPQTGNLKFRATWNKTSACGSLGALPL